MTQKKSSKAASPSKGGAARAEKTPKPREFEFKGVKLTGPPSLNGEDAYVEVIDFAAHAEEGFGVIAAHRLLEAILGRPQLLQVFPTLKSPEDHMDLLTTILAEYGLEMGES